MAIASKHLTTLVELSERRHSPQGADLQRGLHIARLFEADPSIPISLKSLAWHQITESHAAAGWEMPEGDRFPACCGAAASAQHGCALLIESVVEHAASISGEVLLLGALAASKSIFGTWNILPAKGAFLIPLTIDTGDMPAANLYQSSVGVKWGAPGNLRKLLAKHSTSERLAGVHVLIPAPELIAARTAACTSDPSELACLIFCAAAYSSVQASAWGDVEKIADQLNSGHNPLDSAYNLGIDQWLDLKVSPPRRAILAAKRILTAVRPT